MENNTTTTSINTVVTGSTFKQNNTAIGDKMTIKEFLAKKQGTRIDLCDRKGYKDLETGVVSPSRKGLVIDNGVCFAMFAGFVPEEEQTLAAMAEYKGQPCIQEYQHSSGQHWFQIVPPTQVYTHKEDASMLL